MEKLEKVYKGQGIIAAKEIKSNGDSLETPEQLYKCMNDYVLDGMPCDRVNEVVLNEENKIIGYAGIVFNGGKEFHYRVKKAESFLFDFTINKEFRGLGYAPKILDLICGWLLDAAGYIDNAVVQSASTINMLQFLYLWAPMILCGCVTALLCLLKVEKANKDLEEQTILN